MFLGGEMMDKLIIDWQEVSDIILFGSEDEDFYDFLGNKNDETFYNVVREIYVDVASRIDCTTCANCCYIFDDIEVDEEDILLLSQGLGISYESCKSKYIAENRTNGVFWWYRFKKIPCSFLKEKKCVLYKYRPRICRTYPLDVQIPIEQWLQNIYRWHEVCLIMFNAYEKLKDVYRDEYSKV